MKTNVSVLMTCYNAEIFIKKSIKSIINQTFKDWELVIIDDGSYDNTIKIIKSFKQKKIKLFKLKKHQGRTKSLNYGLKKCIGKYIAIQDADDFSNKDRLKKQYQFLEKNKKYSMVSSWYKLLFEKSKKIKFKKVSLNYKIIRKHLLINQIPHSSIMFLKSQAIKFGKYSIKLRYAQDWGLILKFLKYSNIKILNMFLINIIMNKYSMTFNNKYKKAIYKDYNRNLNYVKNNFKLNLLEILILNLIFLKNKIKFFLS